MRSYSFLLALVGVGLLVAPAAQSRLATTSAEATFALPEVQTELVALDLRNTGTEPIRCMRAFAPTGTTFEVASGPPGTNSEASGVFSNASLNVPPGGSASWMLATDPPLTPANPPRVNVSSDCRSDFPAVVKVVAKEVPKPKPCECKSVVTRTSGWGDIQGTSPRTPTRFSFRLQWSLTCVGAPGSCRGEIVIFGPGDVKLTAPKKTTIGCKGKCGAGGKPTVSTGRIRVAGTSAVTLDSNARGGKSFKFRFVKYCIRNGKRVKAGVGSLTVAYRANGLLDLNRSDLNGDGKPGRR